MLLKGSNRQSNLAPKRLRFERGRTPIALLARPRLASPASRASPRSGHFLPRLLPLPRSTPHTPPSSQASVSAMQLEAISAANFYGDTLPRPFVVPMPAEASATRRGRTVDQPLAQCLVRARTFRAAGARAAAFSFLMRLPSDLFDLAISSFPFFVESVAYTRCERKREKEKQPRSFCRSDFKRTRKKKLRPP